MSVELCLTVHLVDTPNLKFAQIFYVNCDVCLTLCVDNEWKQLNYTFTHCEINRSHFSVVDDFHFGFYKVPNHLHNLHNIRIKISPYLVKHKTSDPMKIA